MWLSYIPSNRKDTHLRSLRVLADGGTGPWQVELAEADVEIARGLLAELQAKAALARADEKAERARLVRAERERELRLDDRDRLERARVDVPEASVADAVMMLDLRDTPALFFKNAGTGRHNMVYRRRDGSIGWVEPH